MAVISKHFAEDLGAAFGEIGGWAKTDPATWRLMVNVTVRIMDARGVDFRAFLEAAGADADEQARGRVTL